ncbi:MAG: DUF350 domain-containing protein [Alkalimonas sp.]|uniref:DUF350 domain-containing protein n=1 Tax=Alkalimonas delamerensis TaxID=265981 RepID=A0ABT9GT20_9GAMM|nr:DUF350 domain-containing protein [Alkalimonas delamerensis]MCC5853145.1 DUF350 domain-containing protein [Alkalimonas sp.]MDP4530128.1 DUF350 domain-containing protein [Alkalimonas delamerensis]
METVWISLAGVPYFAVYFALAALLLLCFARIYSWVTPHHEFDLIRADNSAAAVAFGGALIGFSIPLSSAITHSMSLLDCAIWGAVALLVQVLTFFVVKLTLKQLPNRIRQGELAAGIFSAACSIAVGILNAASMSY